MFSVMYLRLETLQDVPALSGSSPGLGSDGAEVYFCGGLGGKSLVSKFFRGAVHVLR